MRPFRFGVLVVVTSAFLAHAQSEVARPPDLPADRNVAAFSERAEAALLAELQDYTPLTEAYLQRFAPTEKLGYILDGDRYALGRFQWLNGPAMQDLLSAARTAQPGDKGTPADDQELLDGLLHIMTPDWRQLSPDRYRYRFAKLEFLGAIRCLVYDVSPLNPENGVFTGRIYLEDRSWNIVRFTGVSALADAMLAKLRGKDSTFRIDGWRINVAKNRWVPAYAYVEEVPPLGAAPAPVIKGQVRFWGYNKKGTPEQAEFSDLVLRQSASAAESRTPQWPSPQQSQRLFENQAEENVLSRLVEGRFLGAAGDVEALLAQVVTNLIVTNKLMLRAPVRCRVLLTTPLEAFTVGNTIVISRGLIDVLPSESALALILAHQLAHNALGHQSVDSRLAFSDVLRISDPELLAKLRFHHTPREEAAADREAMKILELSPYAKTMADGGLFLQALQARVERLPNLIQPHFGEHVADPQHNVRNNPITRTAQVLDQELPDQVAALPLGSKLVVHPWDGRVELLRSEPVPAPALRERKELTVTPFAPRLDYAHENASAPNAPTVKLERSLSRGRPEPARAVRPTIPSTARPSVRSPRNGSRAQVSATSKLPPPSVAAPPASARMAAQYKPSR